MIVKWKKLTSQPFVIFLLLAMFETSGSGKGNATKISHLAPDLDMVPCSPEASFLDKGMEKNTLSCIQCLEEDFLIERDETTQSNHDFLCSHSPFNLEAIRINEGKRLLRGNTIKMVTVIRQPFVERKDGVFVGVVIEVLDALQEKYNFSRSIHLREDGKWGSGLPNGSWDGMVGQVKDKEVDIGITGFSIIYERTQVVEFSLPFHQDPAAILIPAPRPGNKFTVLVRPFHLDVWLTVFATIFALGPSLYALHIASLRIHGDQTSKVRPQLLCDVFQFIIGSLVQEGLKPPVQKTNRTRFVVILWWFSTLVLANIYTGYMVSFLSAPKLRDIVDDLEGLVNQRELRWSYRESTALGTLFQASTTGVYAKVRQGINSKDYALSDQDGVDKVLNSGKYAFIKEKSYLDVKLSEDYIHANKTCRITTAKEKFFTTGAAFIFQKGSKYLELFDFEIGVALTTGLMEKWKAMHWPKNLQCENAASYILKTQPKTRKLNLDDCQGANVLLACGLLSGSIAFIGEIIKQKYQSFWASVKDRWQKRCHGKKKEKEDFGIYKIVVIPVKEQFFQKMIHEQSQ